MRLHPTTGIATNIYDKEKLSKPASYYASIRPVNFAREEAARAEKEAKAAAAKKPAAEG